MNVELLIVFVLGILAGYRKALDDNRFFIPDGIGKGLGYPIMYGAALVLIIIIYRVLEEK